MAPPFPPSVDSSCCSSHYDVLQVPPTADLSQITKAYHQAARQYHPDRNKNNNNNECVDLFRRIQQAWECLRSGETRQAYDATLLWQQVQEKQRRNSALVLSLRDCYYESNNGTTTTTTACMEGSSTGTATTDEAVEVELFYNCRCGCQLNISENADPNDNLLECHGCSLLYDTTPIWDAQDDDYVVHDK